MPDPLPPAFGPEGIAKLTAVLESGCPQLLVKVAVTVAVDRIWCVCVSGTSATADPWHGPVVIFVHWLDSLAKPGQLPGSMPPLFRTCPVSLYDVVWLSTVTSTTGIRPLFVQLPTPVLPPGPMSEVSKPVGVGPVQPAPSPVPSWVTMRLAPGARSAAGHPV